MIVRVAQIVLLLSEVTEEEGFTGIVSKMNIDDEFYLLTRKETGESFVFNMSLEELGKTILEEEHLIKENSSKIPSLSKRQKFLCTCDIYHEVLDESVCDTTKQILQEIKDGEDGEPDGEPEKKSCPEGNQPNNNETEKTEGIQCKKSQRLKEKEENWENNNKFMILKKETGQKWANISRVCSSDVDDYMVNQPKVDF